MIFKEDNTFVFTMIGKIYGNILGENHSKLKTGTLVTFKHFGFVIYVNVTQVEIVKQLFVCVCVCVLCVCVCVCV